jgi:hypothetical protein
LRGEEVVFQGTMHILLNITEDESGGVHVIGHTNLERMTGTGVESVDRYVVSEIHNTAVNSNNLVFTEVIHARLVHTGEDGTHTDDTLIHVTVHIEGGQVTARNFVFHCD